MRTDIRNAGGTVLDHEVVIDRTLVSSRTSDDLPAFRATIIEESARRHQRLSIQHHRKEPDPPMKEE